MDEGRKRVLLIAASILAARKLAQYDGVMTTARVPATISAIGNAIRWAEQIMKEQEIDERWPSAKGRIKV